MKVLLLTNLFPRVSNKNGGIFITSRLREYRKFKISFDVVSLTYKDDFLVRALKKILRRIYNDPLKEIEGIDYKVFRWNIIKYLFYKLGLLNLFRSLCKSIDKKFDLEQYDIIHAHGMYGDVPAGLIAKFLAEKYNKPFVVTLHGSDVNVLMPQRSSEYKRVLESSSANIFVSKALLEKAKSYGYSGKNAVVIPNGYDPSIFYSVDKEGIRNELGILKKDYKYLGFVGNLVYIKRADKLGEIFNNIARKYPKTYFIVVGDGPMRDIIKKEAQGLNIIFTGRIQQKEVAKWINAMDVMILPSRNEGWPCVVLEAQACGTCVIGSNNGGIPEAIGFPEYVVEEGKDFEERISERVVEVLKKGYDKERLIERAKNFTWGSLLGKEIEVYKQVILNK